MQSSFGKGVNNLGQSILPWDGSCIPEVPVGYESSDTGMFEVIIDILKGVFFLPQIGMHVRTSDPKVHSDGVRTNGPKGPQELRSHRSILLRYNNGIKLNDPSLRTIAPCLAGS